MIGWVDVETSGLEPDDALLEIAIVITDDNLKPLHQFASVIYQDDYSWLDRVRSQPVVFEMHRNSGLIADVLAADSLGHLHRTIALIEDWLSAIIVEDKDNVPMAGSSVQFDRRMLQRWMSSIENGFFTYRNIDVSTIKELARRWIPKSEMIPLLEARPKAHRALPDVFASIEELRGYVECGFIQPTEINFPALTPMPPSLPETGSGAMPLRKDPVKVETF